MSRSRTAAGMIVASFERYVEDAVMAGGGHPDLMEWRAQRLVVARERLKLHLMGQDTSHLRMPEMPDVSYDR